MSPAQVGRLTALAESWERFARTIHFEAQASQAYATAAAELRTAIRSMSAERSETIMEGFMRRKGLS